MTELTKKKKREYWTIEQEEAVKQYLEMADDSEEADKLFSQKIYPSLKTLVENIMFTYHLQLKTGDIKEQVDDVVGFVALKFNKFDPAKGHKSFSYYGTIAKNYMILKKTQEYTKAINAIEIDALEGFEFENDLFELPSQDSEYSSKEYIMTYIASELEQKLQRDLTLDPSVYKVGEVVVYLLRNYSGINVYSKNQFYFIAKEFTGLKTKDITRSLFKIKELFAEIGLISSN